MAVADSGRSARCRRDGLWQPAVAPAQQRRIELALDHGLDELADPLANASLNRIEPIVE